MLHLSLFQPCSMTWRGTIAGWGKERDYFTLLKPRQDIQRNDGGLPWGSLKTPLPSPFAFMSALPHIFCEFWRIWQSDLINIVMINITATPKMQFLSWVKAGKAVSYIMWFAFPLKQMKTKSAKTSTKEGFSELSSSASELVSEQSMARSWYSAGMHDFAMMIFIYIWPLDAA